MEIHLHGLLGLPFWSLVFAGAILLASLSDYVERVKAFAAINLIYLFINLGAWALLPVVAALGISRVLRCSQAVDRYRAGFLLVLLSLVLFVVNKRPELWPFASSDGMVRIAAICGYSYLTLRIISLVKWVKTHPEDAPQSLEAINYLVPFHMLAAGPIQAYEDFTRGRTSTSASRSHELTLERSLAGFERIVHGLFKKFVIASIIGDVFLSGFATSGPYLFIETQLFFIWLYLDFSAYSDIAVGIGILLGVKTPENFRRPYLARNIIDFWERWHITLSEFVRNEIFFPLQLLLVRRTRGNNVLLCASLAFTVAFILCGLWHGITLRFFCWGLYHAFGLVLCNAYRSYLKNKFGVKDLKRYNSNRVIRIISTIVTFEFVAFSLLIFAYPL